MKKDWKYLDKWRKHDSVMGSPDGAHYGAFSIKHEGVWLNVIAADGIMVEGDEQFPAGFDLGWEHVSVHVFDPAFKVEKTPIWAQMAYVKNLFWEDDEVVVEYHVAAKDHINVHEHVLHLFRPTKETIPLPPKELV